MDQWLKTGTMKRTLNEKEKNKEKVQRRDDLATVAIVEPLDASSASLPQPEHDNSTLKVKRKYHKEYIQYGFFWTGDEEDPKPCCVL